MIFLQMVSSITQVMSEHTDIFLVIEYKVLCCLRTCGRKNNFINGLEKIGKCVISSRVNFQTPIKRHIQSVKCLSFIH